MKTKETERADDVSISLLPISHANEEAKKGLLELQLKMATSSVNHEYARMEFDTVEDNTKREELLDYMNECRNQYFDARSKLSAHDPYAVADFEADLMRQKQIMLPVYQA